MEVFFLRKRTNYIGTHLPDSPSEVSLASRTVFYTRPFFPEWNKCTVRACLNAKSTIAWENYYATERVDLRGAVC